MKNVNSKNVPVGRFSDLEIAKGVLVSISHISWDGEWVSTPDVVYVGKFQPLYFNPETKTTSFVPEKEYFLYGYVCYEAYMRRYDESEIAKPDEQFVVMVTSQNFEARSPHYFLD